MQCVCHFISHSSCNVGIVNGLFFSHFLCLFKLKSRSLVDDLLHRLGNSLVNALSLGHFSLFSRNGCLQVFCHLIQIFIQNSVSVNLILYFNSNYLRYVALGVDHDSLILLSLAYTAQVHTNQEQQCEQCQYEQNQKQDAPRREPEGSVVFGSQNEGNGSVARNTLDLIVAVLQGHGVSALLCALHGTGHFIVDVDVSGGQVCATLVIQHIGKGNQHRKGFAVCTLHGQRVLSVNTETADRLAVQLFGNGYACGNIACKAVLTDQDQLIRSIGGACGNVSSLNGKRFGQLGNRLVGVALLVEGVALGQLRGYNVRAVCRCTVELCVVYVVLDQCAHISGHLAVNKQHEYGGLILCALVSDVGCILHGNGVGRSGNLQRGLGGNIVGHLNACVGGLHLDIVATNLVGIQRDHCLACVQINNLQLVVLVGFVIVAVYADSGSRHIALQEIILGFPLDRIKLQCVYGNLHRQGSHRVVRRQCAAKIHRGLCGIVRTNTGHVVDRNLQVGGIGKAIGSCKSVQHRVAECNRDVVVVGLPRNVCNCARCIAAPGQLLLGDRCGQADLVGQDRLVLCVQRSVIDCERDDDLVRISNGSRIIACGRYQLRALIGSIQCGLEARLRLVRDDDRADVRIAVVHLCVEARAVFLKRDRQILLSNNHLLTCGGCEDRETTEQGCKHQNNDCNRGKSEVSCFCFHALIFHYTSTLPFKISLLCGIFAANRYCEKLQPDLLYHIKKPMSTQFSLFLIIFFNFFEFFPLPPEFWWFLKGV